MRNEPRNSWRCLVLTALIFAAACTSADQPAYLDTSLSFEERAADLVSRMTLEEKVSQLTYTADSVGRLGIPEYNWWNECLHGVARSGKATVFPQAIGMAASFDRELMYRMAEITSTEARAKYNGFQAEGKRGIYQGLTFWSPNINIFRDPRWGRGQETYGEDPYLSGEMGLQFVRGLQGDHPRYLKTVATVKHYAVHSGPEPLRHSFDAVVSERDFRETYLPAFRKCVVDGKAWSVMCAYNRYKGQPCCGSPSLQEELLRGEFGFPGYIVSDCGAIADFHTGHQVVETPAEAASFALMSGTDLNCGDQFPFLLEAVEQNLVSEADIDTALTRLMLARMKLGMFDPDDMLPWSDLGAESVASPEHRQVALDMARSSIVLLKNEGQALPLDPGSGKIAVIGPNADNAYVQYGNYNGFSDAPVSVLDGIREKVGDDSRVRYAQGCPHHEGMPYLRPVPAEVLFSDKAATVPGLTAEYFDNPDAEGKPVLTQTEATVDRYFWDGQPPEEGLCDEAYAIRWSGYLVPRRSGKHAIGIYGNFFRFEMDGEALIDGGHVHHPVKTFRELELKAGQPYKIEILMADRYGDANCTFHWQEPALPLLKEAEQIAAWADQIVLVMGLTARLEGEEMRGIDLEGFKAGDRTNLKLPAVQRRLIRRMVATGKPLTLVLMTGSAVSINEEDKTVPAILQAWYGGEKAGTAVADVLFGDYNPAGRLPLTFYRSVDDLPPFGSYDMRGRTYKYFQGEVLYPFGYGLSYSEFKYSNLILEETEISGDQEIQVSIELENTSGIDGEEVVQMYIRSTKADSLAPLRSLKGFKRVAVKAGQRLVVTMPLGPAELEQYDPETGKYGVMPGSYEVMVGPSSAPEKLISASLVVGEF
ncbi:MAG: glucan 1,4-alpha-glucosidase [Bacteroidetes bacterium]|nr:MAG: glucan 1,4-alpha-glucosidase [Bacteroidota bacterium]